MGSVAGTGVDKVEVLRDGFPSYVIRVRASGYMARRSVVLKACPESSREPEVMRALGRLGGLAVPAVLDVKQADGFRVLVLEDIGEDALWKHPDTAAYLVAVREIARVHRQLERDQHGDRGLLRETANRLPSYGAEEWVAVVSSAATGTMNRITDGTYLMTSSREGMGETLKRLEERTLDIIGRAAEMLALGPTLIHGDYHEGNVLIRPRIGADPGRLAIVDWGSARWDSGVFDLVSLLDVAERMGTIDIGRSVAIQAYTRERCSGRDAPCLRDIEMEWHRCCLLRSWDELRWFSEAGEDFGDRVPREIDIIREQTEWFSKMVATSWMSEGSDRS